MDPLLWLVVKLHMGYSSYVYVYNKNYTIKKRFNYCGIYLSLQLDLEGRLRQRHNYIGRVSIKVTSGVWRDMAEAVMSLSLYGMRWERSVV